MSLRRCSRRISAAAFIARRYALKFSDDPIYFGAIVRVFRLFCTMIFSVSPPRKDRLISHRQSVGYFIAGGTLESLGLLLVLYALSYGPVVMVTPFTSTLPLWVVIWTNYFARRQKITTRIVIGALLVAAGTISLTLTKS